MRSCEACRADLSWRSRADARYCSSACRQRAYRARESAKRVPVALKTRPRWVNVARHSKRPVTAAGRVASISEPSTWSTYSTAAKAAQKRPAGFVLTADNDIACVDLDGCIGPDGALTEAAEAFLAAAGSTFVEISMSGRGLHIWGRGLVPRGRRRMIAGQAVEVYGQGRYIAVTGKTFRGAAPRLGNIQHLIDLLSQ